MGVRLLIDADVIAYRAAFASEKTKYLVAEEDCKLLEYDDAKTAKASAELTDAYVWSRKEVADVDQATMIADVMVREMKDRYAAENPSVSLYLSGVGNFRYSIATRASYKGGRSQPPVHLKAVREHLIAMGAVVSAGEEADDLIGIAVTAEPTSVVCSIDKDLMQLPGRHYNFVTKEEVTVTKKAAVLNLYTQVIAGDSTDNIPGCGGMGPVKARKAIAECKNAYECWRTALDIYGAVYGKIGPGFCLETAHLVFVRRTVGGFFTPPMSNGMSNEAEKTEAHSNKAPSRGGRVSKRARAIDSGATDSAGGGV